ncbi:MFS transporter [Nocardia niwae]|uniref:MFS transporter n=1 Tax=Nocardia niwae TaxID=626084 RepID=A0ABV2X6Z9_9NOCA
MTHRASYSGCRWHDRRLFVTDPTVTPDRILPSDNPHRFGPILVALVICQLMIILDVTVVNVALPSIRADLEFTATGLSWVSNAYTLAFGGLLLLGARAGDLIGRRTTFVAGLALFTAASLAGGLAPGAGWLITARVAQGIGAALAGPNALALLTTIFTDPDRRMRALAWYSGMAGVGFAVGLVVGGLLTEWATWRSVLLINVPLGAASIGLTLRHIPQPPRRPARLDARGALAATAGIAALVFGFLSAAEPERSNSAIIGALGAGVVLILLFLAIERRARQPLLPLRLFADRNRAVAYTNVFVCYMASMSMFFFLTLYLQNVRGMSPVATGFAFLPTAVLMFALIRAVPVLLRKFGPKLVTMTGAVSMVAGLLLLTRLTTETSYFPVIFAAAALMGCGTGLALMPLAMIIMADIPTDLAGAAGGAAQTIQQLGAALGLAILVSVFGAFTDGTADPLNSVMVTGITAAFVAASVMATTTLLGTFLFRSRV